MARWRVFRQLLIGPLVLALLAPLDVVWSLPLSLGTVRGVRGTRVSLDHGKTWLAPNGRGLPVLSGTELKTLGGLARIELADGSRLDVLPFSALRVEEAHGVPQVAVTYGRLTFRLTPEARVEILTPSARLEPVRREVMAGELFVDGTGLTGLKMAQGQLQVSPLSGPRRPLLASLEPVFLPKAPAGPGPFFASDGPPPPPAGARAVFAASGESVGYLTPQGGLVIHPGFAADLTRPFHPRLVRLAMASIPEKRRNGETVPLFDVNGAYVGYLSGPLFYAQAQQETPQNTPPPGGGEGTGGTGSEGLFGGMSTTTMLVLGAGAVAAIGGAAIGLAGAGGGGGGGGPTTPPPATPIAP